MNIRLGQIVTINKKKYMLKCDSIIITEEDEYKPSLKNIIGKKGRILVGEETKEVQVSGIFKVGYINTTIYYYEPIIKV